MRYRGRGARVPHLPPRAKISPDQAGLPPAGRRRVPGLRRSEVDQLAGMSVEYSAKFERGTLAGVSAGVLDSLARALQLDDAGRAHLPGSPAKPTAPTDSCARRGPRDGACDRLCSKPRIAAGKDPHDRQLHELIGETVHPQQRVSPPLAPARRSHARHRHLALPPPHRRRPRTRLREPRPPRRIRSHLTVYSAAANSPTAHAMALLGRHEDRQSDITPSKTDLTAHGKRRASTEGVGSSWPFATSIDSRPASQVVGDNCRFSASRTRVRVSGPPTLPGTTT